MNKIPVAKHLTDEEYHQLLQTWSDHNASMNFEDCAKYDIGYVVEVIRKENEDLQVCYEDGKSWNYTPDGRWY